MEKEIEELRKKYLSEEDEEQRKFEQKKKEIRLRRLAEEEKLLKENEMKFTMQTFVAEKEKDRQYWDNKMNIMMQTFLSEREKDRLHWEREKEFMRQTFLLEKEKDRQDMAREMKVMTEKLLFQRDKDQQHWESEAKAMQQSYLSEKEKDRQHLAIEMKVMTETFLSQKEKDQQHWEKEMRSLTQTCLSEKQFALQRWVIKTFKQFEREIEKCTYANAHINEDNVSSRDDDDYELDGIPIYDGTPETQVLKEGEADIQKQLSDCKKNPGHTQFVPVNDFNTNHLPKGYRDNDIVKYIKAIADLTVRVDVKMTSTNRPEFRRHGNLLNPCYNTGGSEMRIGTAMVKSLFKHDFEDSDKTCTCHRCHDSEKPSHVWWEIRLWTSTQVVFDDLEAKHTTCRLFYDKQDSTLVTLNDFTVESRVDEGWCEMKCSNCDLNLCDKLDTMTAHRSSVSEKLCKKYRSFRDDGKLAFIVSHPHGASKQVSVGHWIERYDWDHEDDFDLKIFYKYTYTTCTCPGSSGAYVNILGYDIMQFGPQIHSGVNYDGTNYSGS